jgi:hypothetical protein
VLSLPEQRARHVRRLDVPNDGRLQHQRLPPQVAHLLRFSGPSHTSSGDHSETLCASPQKLGNPCTERALALAGSPTTSLALGEPSHGHDVDPQHDRLSTTAGEGGFLGVEDLLEHLDDDVVGYAESEEELDGPGWVGADGGVLAFCYGVLADAGQEGVDGEDEAVQGCAVSDGFDAGGDQLVGLGRWCGWHLDISWEGLAGSVIVPYLLTLYDFEVNAGDEVVPCLGNDAGVVVVRRMEDQEADIVVVGLVGEIIEQLQQELVSVCRTVLVTQGQTYCGEIQDWAIQSFVHFVQSLDRNSAVILKPLEEIILNMSNLEEIGDLVVQ